MSDVFDPEVVEQARAGDQRAGAALLTHLETLFRRYFLSRIGPREEVDDLVQNALVRVHSSLTAIQQPDRFKAFAMKAAVFELQDFYRGRYSSREARFDPDLPTPGTTNPEPTGDRVDLERALETLTPKARQILELRQMGYLYKEIAEIVDTTEAAVKMQVKRAFERLRGTLGVAALFAFAVLASGWIA